MPTELDYRHQIMELMRSYRPAQVLVTCAELGIFAALGTDSKNAKDLAQALSVDAPALARLMNSAIALGYLEKRGEQYANSPAALACLAVEGPAFIGNLVKREAAFQRRWTRLPEAVRMGHRPEENNRDEKQLGWVRSFELALKDAARTMAPAVAESLRPLMPPREAVRVIDVGGGHGMYSIALAQRYPNVHAIVFDLPPVVEVTREIIAESKMGERVSAQAGDFKVNDLGSGFDLALLFGVLISETAANSIALLEKVYAALAPGGYVVIRGTYLAPDRTSPTEATLFDLQMLLSTQAGQVHTTDEVTTWSQQVGFTPSEKIHVSSGEMIMLSVARKPA